MHWISFALLFIFISISFSDDFEKYRELREQCTRTPSNSECLKLKSKFGEVLQKCQQINTQKQAILCQQVKNKLCAIFPTSCTQTTTTGSILTTRRRAAKPKSKITTTTTTTTTTSQTMTNEEFIQVPVNPDELRTRGEYCVRHGKEKKCQQLLNNLKNTYSSCNKKKPQTIPIKSEQLDCHSFQTHLCKAFPKFPPCIKKTSKL
jgi:hypothetical protein